MIILEIVEKLTEENTYFSAYIAELSTRDHSRRSLLNVQTQVCAASGSKCGEVHEHIFLLYFFTTRRDGPVWKSQGLSSVPGRSRCSPKCRHWISWKTGADAPSCFPPRPAVSPSAAAQSSASVPQLPLCSLLLEAFGLVETEYRWVVIKTLTMDPSHLAPVQTAWSRNTAHSLLAWDLLSRHMWMRRHRHSRCSHAISQTAGVLPSHGGRTPCLRSHGR